MTVHQLRDVPDTHSKPQSSMRKALKASEDLIVTTATLGRRPALLAITPQGLLVAAPGGFSHVEVQTSWDKVGDIRRAGSDLTVESRDFGTHTFNLGGPHDAAAFAGAAIAARYENRPPGSAPARVNPPTAASQVLIVTTNDVPGHDILAVHGDVFGLIVRSRSVVMNAFAGLQGLVGGEIDAYTTLLTRSRNDARERLAAEALRRGGNAVVAFRFDCNEFAETMSEVAAYGTAVTIQRRPAPADPGDD